MKRRTQKAKAKQGNAAKRKARPRVEAQIRAAQRILVSMVAAMMQQGTLLVAGGDAREAGRLLRVIQRGDNTHRLAREFIALHSWLLEMRQIPESWNRHREWEVVA